MFKSTQIVNAMTQSINPYRFDYTNYKNEHSSTLRVQSDAESMKLRTCCRIDARYTAVHFRNSTKQSEFYIVDLLTESIVYSSTHKPEESR